MKATQQYFPVVLFIMLFKVVLTFESVDKILWCDNLNADNAYAFFFLGGRGGGQTRCIILGNVKSGKYPFTLGVIIQHVPPS